MEDQSNKSTAESQGNQAPPDPSNTSHIGQKIEQGVIKKEEGIAEQSSAWEDKQERPSTGDNLIDEKAERYIKNPSPEENNSSDDVDASELTGGKNNAGKSNTSENNPAL